MKFQPKPLTNNPASVGVTSYRPGSPEFAELAAQVTPLDRIRKNLSHMPTVALGARASTVKSRRRHEDVLNLR